MTILQTITWGDNQGAHFPRLFAQASSAGYTGLEIGWRRLSDWKAADLENELAKHRLHLWGIHIGGNLLDADQAEGEHAALDEVIAYAKALDTPRLLFSGLRDAARFPDELEQLRRANNRCQECGISLLYHNHDWEFSDTRWQHLRTANLTGLGYCIDVGWAHRAGQDVIPLLEILGDSLAAIHFKDFATDGPAVDTVPLGHGIVPLAAVHAWARTHKPNLSLVAEQDHSTDPANDIAMNAHFLSHGVAK